MVDGPWRHMQVRSGLCRRRASADGRYCDLFCHRL